MNEQYADHYSSIYEAVPEGKVFRIVFDSVTQQMKVLAKDCRALEELREAFSAENEQAFFSRQYGYASESKKYQINKFGYFAPGLVFEVLDWIKTSYGDLRPLAISKNCLAYISDILTPLKAQLKGKTLEIANISDETGRNSRAVAEGKPEYKFRDYQQKSIEALLMKGYGRGLIEIPTSGGKSFIIANFIWNLHKHVNSEMKAMIFVPNTQLVEQFYKDLLDYGYNKENLAKFCGAMKAKERKQQDLKHAQIIIANRQYVFSNASKLPKIDILVVDEVHTATANVSKEFIQKCGARVKVGCSGTIPKGKFARWDLLGLFGNVVYREEVTDLQDQGFVSKLKITVLDIMHKGVESNRHCLFHIDSLHKYKPDELGNSEVFFNEAYTAELEFYKKSSYELYEPVMSYLNGLDENILVLFDRIETGKNIFDMAQKLVTSKKAFYIDGSTEITLREDARQAFEQSGNNILVGNVSIVGTGINIKRLKHVVFIASTKSFSRVIQSIGRILRLHNTKDEAHLIDIVLNTKYSRRHYAERLKYYKEVYHKKKPDEVIKFEV